MSRNYQDGDATNPEHYRQGGKECIDAMYESFIEYARKARPASGDAHGIAWLMLLGFCLGNAFKYRWRAGLKDGESAEKGIAAEVIEVSDG